MTEVSETKGQDSFPYLSICSLCVGVITQCITFTAPLPFIAFMVVDFGASKSLDTAGYSAGWIAGIYMIGRISSGVAIGILSDKWGRKPCLVISMINVAVLSILFGLSTSYTMALVTRFLCGVGNGFMSVCQTVVTELVHNKDHETRAFGYVNGAFGLGYIIGPAIGGLLARPALQYPSLFSSHSLWGHFPYLMPCLICSLIAVLAAVLIQLYVPETIKVHHTGESEKAKSDVEENGEKIEIEMTVSTACNTTKDNKQYGSLATEESEPVNGISSTGNGPTTDYDASPSSQILLTEILSDSRLCLIIFMNFFFCCFSVMIEEVFPLWCVSSVSVGGLAWSSSQVGIVLLCTGIGLVTFQIFFYGPLMAHFSQYSSETMFFFQNVIGGIPIILMPVGQWFALQLMNNDTSSSTSNWIVFSLIVFFYSIHSFIIGTVYATIAMVVNSSVPAAKRGTMNGMTGTASSIGNFFAPVIGANLFAVLDSWNAGDGGRTVDGRVVFVVCGFLLMALGYMVKVKLVPVEENKQ